MKPSAPLLKTTTFTGRSSCARLRKSPISMAKPPSPDSEMTCRPGNADCAPIVCAIALAMEPCQNEPSEPPLAVHREIAGGPHRRQTDIAGEDGVGGSVVADRLGDLLRMDRPPARPADRQLVESLARLAIMFRRLIEMRAVALFRQQRQQRLERRPDIADDAKIDRRAPSDLLRPEIDLRNARRRPRDRTGGRENRSPASAARRNPASRSSPTRSRSDRSCRRRRDSPTRHAPCP